jgi:hypothetical protein
MTAYPTTEIRTKEIELNEGYNVAAIPQRRFLTDQTA